MASEDEKQPLAERHDILRKELLTFRRAEWHRRRRKERARKRDAFISNPFAFTKKLLGDKRSGSIMCPTKEVNFFLHNTLSDPERDQELEPPTVGFDMTEPNWKEVQEVVKGDRSASAPGPSGEPSWIPFTVPGSRWILQGLEKLITWEL